MIRFKAFGIPVEIRFFFVATLTYMLFADSQSIILYGFISSLIHEAAHLMMMCVFREQPDKVIFTVYGICIAKKENPTVWQEVLILLAGPVVNLLIFVLITLGGDMGGQYSLIAAYNLVLGFFNLLPIGSLDGGRILSLLLEYRLGEQRGGKISMIISVLVLLPLAVWAFSLFLSERRNITLFVVILFLMATIFSQMLTK